MHRFIPPIASLKEVPYSEAIQPKGIWASAHEPFTLADIHYGIATAPPFRADKSPKAYPSMKPLKDSPQGERWTSLDKPTYGSIDGIDYAATDDLLIGVGRWPATSIRKATTAAYHSFLGATERLGYEHLLRVWQFFPDIHCDEDDLERYQSFCLARHEALHTFGFNMRQNLPAASALGSSGEDLWLIFIAGNGTMLTLENPNQVSAFNYPPIYGPKSPSFSRAVRFKSPQHDLVFISGTASILGYETHAPEDTRRQCEITIDNLSTLLKTHNLKALWRWGEQAAFKIYLRRAEDQALVKACLNPWLHPSSPVIWLEADICRRDLLLEIEATLDLSGSSWHPTYT